MIEQYCWYERDLVNASGTSGFAHSGGRIKRTRTGAWKVDGKQYRTYHLAFSALFRGLGGIAIG